MNVDSLDDSSLSYVAQFRLHQNFVQAHLKGAEQSLLPAFFPPSSYWTAQEKDLFFHGLAVYSRFRPDLIAESIKTKTTFDVCLYLDILQTASSRMIPSEVHGSFRSSLEPAMEVSNIWIQNEEQIAAALIQLDSCTWTPESADGETKKSCVCSPQSLLVDHSSHTELERSHLSHLDCTCLMALEKIVRKAQLSEVDSAAVPLSTTSDSFGQPVTRTSSVVDKDLSDLDSHKLPTIASETPKPNSSKLEAQYRLMKRLYMRRKRAHSTGKPINIEAIRLPPGRRTRDRKPPRPRPKTYKSRSVLTPVEEINQGDEAQYETRSKGGLKRLYRRRNRFLEIGIDSQLASKNDLDLFHLSSLAQLMRLYGSLNNSSHGVSISADTIQLLAAILKKFVSEIVRGSLLCKEQEIRLKSASKVWKYDQKEITVENVKETLKFMGIARLNLKDYLAELVEEGNDDVPSPNSSIDTDVGTKDGNDDDSSGDHNNLYDDEDGISNEDTVVDSSSASDASKQSAEPSSHTLTEFGLPQYCLLPKDFRISENEGDLLPEINEIELQRELKEEEELDSRDLLASKEFEVGLWGS